MIQLLKQIDDQVHHIVYHQEGRTLFYREGIASKEKQEGSGELVQVNVETATVVVKCRHVIAAYRQKKEWIRLKKADGYFKSDFPSLKTMDKWIERRSKKRKVFVALFTMLCGLSSLTGVLPVPGYIPLFYLPWFWPVDEGKSRRARFYRWYGAIMLIPLGGTSKDFLNPINLSISGTVCLVSGFLLLLHVIQMLKEEETKEVTL
ncbi:hypothetical protein [Exiguobacterium oxidotolerans]|uniref:Uncharacterized protein n=1 Tax=Exiguobacterium oxidotolerans TaxID=223958 RepID=A0A653I6U6_9BACL|nr:hypothetical protein [Exiguobacterium oxidotolerans]VWX34581.1 conserved hypothetical protein [Exiguobacterium oxidotolerans]